MLHPDENHNDHAGTEAGFGYHLLYIDPAVTFDAVRVLCGHAGALPFVREPVTTSPTLAAAIQAAFQGTREPHALDSLLVDLLSAPLTIPLVCRDINGFRRVSRGGEAMARRQQEERRVGSASRGMVRRLGCCCLPGAPPCCL